MIGLQRVEPGSTALVRLQCDIDLLFRPLSHAGSDFNGSAKPEGEDRLRRYLYLPLAGGCGASGPGGGARSGSDGGAFSAACQPPDQRSQRGPAADNHKIPFFVGRAGFLRKRSGDGVVSVMQIEPIEGNPEDGTALQSSGGIRFGDPSMEARPSRQQFLSLNNYGRLERGRKCVAGLILSRGESSVEPDFELGP